MSIAAFPIGVDVRVNSATNADYPLPAVAALAGGGFVVTWMSDQAEKEVVAQLYNALGVPQGPQFTVNSTSNGDQTRPSVAALSDGGFIVTWTDDTHTFADSGLLREVDIYARRYSAGGITTAPGFQVNSPQSSGDATGSVVTGLADGGFVVIWSQGQGSDIFGQRYSATGGQQGAAFQVNDYTPGMQSGIAVTAANDGGFIVTWTSPEAFTSTTEIEVQRYNSAGAPLSPVSQRVNPNQTGQQYSSSVATLKDGRVVFTWTSQDEDGSGQGVYGRVGLGAAFRINGTTVDDQAYPNVTALNDGGFLVTWTSLGQDGSGFGVYGRQYDSTGLPSFAEFRINATTVGSQYANGPEQAATLANGQVVQVWFNAETNDLFYRFISTQGTAARDDAYVLLAGNVLTAGSATSLLANDEASSPPTIKTVITGRGVIDSFVDGTFTYFPQGFTGIDHLRYTFADPQDGSTETANISIYVVPVNVGPTSTTLDLVGLTAGEQIAATYVAFFGRGADAGGHDFWVNQFNVGKATQSPSTLFSNIASSFGISNEAKALYPFLVSPFGASDATIASFLNSVYDNLFNRPSDAGGLTYWTAQTKATLQAGKFIGSILVDIMSGAQDTVAGKDITTLMSKVAVSLHYVEAQKELHSTWTSGDDLAEAKALLDGVTNAASTVLVGIAQADHLVAADAV